MARGELGGSGVARKCSIFTCFRYPRSMGFPRAVAHTILMRIALYARVSLKDGRRDCENHLIQLRAFCLRSGRTVLDEYKEHLR